MKNAILPILLALLSVPLVAAEPEFPLREDSKPKDGIPKGEMLKGTYTAKPGSVFPGTVREYQIYLPPGVDRAGTLPFMVFQDGVIYQAPVVFDNLIARKEIPPLAGIFVKPGVVPAAHENALPRFNRSLEYDSITQDYATFLIDELLPSLEKAHGIRLSADPNDAAISGNSSGGIAAFMVAWHRPDRFRRVFTGVGTYVGIHGADALPVFVRKMEPKPLRVFLQSGTNDNNLYCGDWWMANQTMERSLTWAGYEVSHAWGDGGHNQKHASQIFPDVLRWLWKDWPGEKAIQANPGGDSKWKGYEIFETGAMWQAHNGAVPSQADRLTPFGEVAPLTLPDLGAVQFGAAVLSPDQTLVYAAETSAPFVHSFQVSPEGKLQNGQRFYQLDTWPADDGAGRGLCVDVEGRLYVATAIGIQVCDQAGRVNFIVPTPEPVQDVFFAGDGRSDLIARCVDRAYQRATKTHGLVSRETPPVKPTAPRL